MWKVISSSSASHTDKLTAAQAQLDYLRREEEEVLQKLKKAQMFRGKGQYMDNETVFNEDYENGTLIDEDSGEVFGFGDLVGIEEETYGFN